MEAKYNISNPEAQSPTPSNWKPQARSPTPCQPCWTLNRPLPAGLSFDAADRARIQAQAVPRAFSISLLGLAAVGEIRPPCFGPGVPSAAPCPETKGLSLELACLHRYGHACSPLPGVIICSWRKDLPGFRKWFTVIGRKECSSYMVRRS